MRKRHHAKNSQALTVAHALVPPKPKDNTLLKLAFPPQVMEFAKAAKAAKYV